MWLARDEMRCGGGYSLWRIKPKKDKFGQWLYRGYDRRKGGTSGPFGERVMSRLSTEGVRAKSKLKPGTCRKVTLTAYGSVRT